VIALAGFPLDQVEAHKKTGVDAFVHLRADAVEVLANFHSKLGIEL
jgi:methylmalonyl-CoA mutase